MFDGEQFSSSSDVRNSISEDAWKLIDQNTGRSICTEHWGSKRMSIRKRIFLDPWEIIDEVDDNLKWAGVLLFRVICNPYVALGGKKAPRSDFASLKNLGDELGQVILRFFLNLEWA